VLKKGNKESPTIASTKSQEVLAFFLMGVSENRGTPKWMVYDGKPS